MVAERIKGCVVIADDEVLEEAAVRVKYVRGRCDRDFSWMLQVSWRCRRQTRWAMKQVIGVFESKPS